MNKKGFTLIELLAVIIILAIVALIATPIILDVISDARKSAGLSESNMILSGINNYCATEEIKVQMDSSYIAICTSSMDKEDIKKIVNLGNAEILEIEYSNELVWLKIKSNGNIYSLKDNIMKEIDLYRDSSGANYPELLDNMVPIKYENDNWIVADIKEEWYDYDKKEWANAVVLNTTKKVGDVVTEGDIDLWYVWIPRYTYTIFNGNNGSVSEQEIKIKFESGTNSSGTVKCVDAISTSGNSSETCTDSTNGSIVNGTSTYTHPAFTFGDEQLTGFWVGKFEISGSTDKITIKPNVSSLRSQTVSTFFNSILNMKTIYNLNGDSHMMKNMEWGAVAYLSHSKYGTCTDGSCVEVGINGSSSYYTGGGTSGAYKTNIVQSTTQNIYGVYDMSGGSWEYVMGNMADHNGNFYPCNSGFSEKLETKYYDRYIYDGSSYTTHGRAKLGDAIKETLKDFENASGGWYDDIAVFPYSISSWLNRGGGYYNNSLAGLFSFGPYGGGEYLNYSSRAVLVK